MCTLTVIQHQGARVITMNRDERRGRTELNRLRQSNGACYPVDIPSDGTWVGANQDGLVLALLNRYQDAEHYALPSRAPQSRGIIIPRLLRLSDQEAVVAELNRWDLHAYSPFDLVISGSDQLLQWVWDGRASYLEQPEPDAFLRSSSSEHVHRALEFRHQRFEQFVSGIEAQGIACEQLADRVLNEFHLGTQGADPEIDAFMARAKTHTKSITQMVAEEGAVSMRYWPEPCLRRGRANTLEGPGIRALLSRTQPGVQAC